LVDPGKLNAGARVDHVLQVRQRSGGSLLSPFPVLRLFDVLSNRAYSQEAPTEAVSQSLFSMASHTSYWHSEDMLLFVLEQVYAISAAGEFVPRA
jgi:hypothetical protein